MIGQNSGIITNIVNNILKLHVESRLREKFGMCTRQVLRDKFHLSDLLNFGLFRVFPERGALTGAADGGGSQIDAASFLRFGH